MQYTRTARTLRNSALGLATLVALGLAAGRPAAAQVYDGGLPNQADGNEMTGWFQANSFTLSSAEDVTGVRFWDLDAGGYNGSITYSFFSDAAGSPGSVLFTGDAPATRIATGKSAYGLGEYQNDLSVSNVALGPGTYWLGLHNGPVSDQDYGTFYWETSGSTNAPFAGKEKSLPFDGAYTSNGYQHAFQLSADATPAPEPASWAAFAFTGLGAAGLMLRARKRKATA